MPTKLLSQAEADALESLIDHKGLSSVLETLAAICYLKAGHVEENWQDANLARRWERAGKKLDKAARDVQGLID